MTTPTTPTVRYDIGLALRAEGLLANFNNAHILTAADVHVARRLGAIVGEADESVLLAVALTVRSTRHGSVVLDLADAQETTSADDDDDTEVGEPAAALAWPAYEQWLAACAASPVMSGALRREGGRLWLARYWEQEEQVAAELIARSLTPADDLSSEGVRAGLQRLFPQASDADQRRAASECATARVCVLAGGPGTGKTTTVARLLALLKEQQPQWRIALAAPTGKAAARLEEAVRTSTATLPPEDRERLGDPSATTLHRLLGWRPGARSRFRHDRTNRLAYEVVVVDESSMVSLTMMARLLESLRPSTRLILVGDPDQLASVEAGAVLGDLVGPGEEHRASPLIRVATLHTNWRFDATSGIGELATAVRAGHADQALDILRSGRTGLELLEVDDDERLAAEPLEALRRDVQDWGGALHEAAKHADATAALLALDQHRLLCAHRRGPRGVQLWSTLAAGWIAERHPVQPRPDGHYAGEPLLVTTNDYDIGLYNGDTGVVIADGDALVAVFGRGGAPFTVPLARLGAVRSLHAMTVHRSQGSQFERITVLLPPAGSPLATRETLYTAVTRAQSHVRIIGSPQALMEAVQRPAARATGLRERLDRHVVRGTRRAL